MPTLVQSLNVTIPDQLKTLHTSNKIATKSNQRILQTCSTTSSLPHEVKITCKALAKLAETSR